MVQMFLKLPKKAEIKTNFLKIKKHYNPYVYGKKLMDYYVRLKKNKVALRRKNHNNNLKKDLLFFLEPERNFLVKTPLPTKSHKKESIKT